MLKYSRAFTFLGGAAALKANGKQEANDALDTDPAGTEDPVENPYKIVGELLRQAPSCADPWSDEYTEPCVTNGQVDCWVYQDEQDRCYCMSDEEQCDVVHDNLNLDEPVYEKEVVLTCDGGLIAKEYWNAEAGANAVECIVDNEKIQGLFYEAWNCKNEFFEEFHREHSTVDADDLAYPPPADAFPEDLTYQKPVGDLPDYETNDQRTFDTNANDQRPDMKSDSTNPMDANMYGTDPTQATTAPYVSLHRQKSKKMPLLSEYGTGQFLSNSPFSGQEREDWEYYDRDSFHRWADFGRCEWQAVDTPITFEYHDPSLFESVEEFFSDASHTILEAVGLERPSLDCFKKQHEVWYPSYPQEWCYESCQCHVNLHPEWYTDQTDSDHCSDCEHVEEEHGHCQSNDDPMPAPVNCHPNKEVYCPMYDEHGHWNGDYCETLPDDLLEAFFALGTQCIDWDNLDWDKYQSVCQPPAVEDQYADPWSHLTCKPDWFTAEETPHLPGDQVEVACEVGHQDLDQAQRCRQEWTDDCWREWECKTVTADERGYPRCPFPLDIDQQECLHGPYAGHVIPDGYHNLLDCPPGEPGDFVCEMTQHHYKVWSSLGENADHDQCKELKTAMHNKDEFQHEEPDLKPCGQNENFHYINATESCPFDPKPDDDDAYARSMCVFPHWTNPEHCDSTSHHKQSDLYLCKSDDYHSCEEPAEFETCEADLLVACEYFDSSLGIEVHRCFSRAAGCPLTECPDGQELFDSPDGSICVDKHQVDNSCDVHPSSCWKCEEKCWDNEQGYLDEECANQCKEGPACATRPGYLCSVHDESGHEWHECIPEEMQCSCMRHRFGVKLDFEHAASEIHEIHENHGEGDVDAEMTRNFIEHMVEGFGPNEECPNQLVSDQQCNEVCMELASGAPEDHPCTRGLRGEHGFDVACEKFCDQVVSGTSAEEIIHHVCPNDEHDDQHDYHDEHERKPAAVKAAETPDQKPPLAKQRKPDEGDATLNNELGEGTDSNEGTGGTGEMTKVERKAAKEAKKAEKDANKAARQAEKAARQAEKAANKAAKQAENAANKAAKKAAKEAKQAERDAKKAEKKAAKKARQASGDKYKATRDTVDEQSERVRGNPNDLGATAGTRTDFTNPNDLGATAGAGRDATMTGDLDATAGAGRDATMTRDSDFDSSRLGTLVSTGKHMNRALNLKKSKKAQASRKSAHKKKSLLRKSK